MKISACPACGTEDIRYETTEVTTYPLVSWHAGDDKPVFVASTEPVSSESSGRVVCVNGHAHPDRVGFDLEWSEDQG